MPFTLMYGNPFVPGMGQDMREGARRETDFARTVQNTQLQLQDREVAAREAQLVLDEKYKQLTHERQTRQLDQNADKIRNQAEQWQSQFDRRQVWRDENIKLGISSGELGLTGSTSDPAGLTMKEQLARQDDIREERNILRKWGFRELSPSDPEQMKEYDRLANLRNETAERLESDDGIDLSRSELQAQLDRLDSQMADLGDELDLPGEGEIVQRARDGTWWVGLQSMAVNEGAVPQEKYSDYDRVTMSHAQSQINTLIEQRGDLQGELATARQEYVRALRTNDDDAVKEATEWMDDIEGRLENVAEGIRVRRQILTSIRARGGTDALGQAALGSSGTPAGIPPAPATAGEDMDNMFEGLP